MKKAVAGFLLFLLLVGCSMEDRHAETLIKKIERSVDVIHFPEEEHPELADFMKAALVETNLRECTLEREGAGKREEKAVRELPPKKGHDRMAWPLSICEEGEKVSYVDYIPSDAKEEAERWLQRQLDTYPDGAKIAFYDIDDPEWILKSTSKDVTDDLIVTIGRPPKVEKIITEEKTKEREP